MILRWFLRVGAIYAWPLGLVIPASWCIGHNIADPAVLGVHAESLQKSYFDLYEGRP